MNRRRLILNLLLAVPIVSNAQTVEVNDSTRLLTNSLDALSGQAAGVTVSSSGADRMAMLTSVRVRGTTSLTGGNDPLVVIDGVYSDLSTLSGIYPADIQSFTILKNAAETAVYGSRGASGVILVTTKKGHGGKFRISYDGNGGFERTYNNLQMLDRNGYINTAKNLGLSYNDGGYDTDFNKAIQRTGFVQNHHVAFEGGNKKSGYRASVGYMQHNAVLRNSSNRNFVAKIDLIQQAFDDLLTIDFGVNGSSQYNTGVFDMQKLLYSAATQNPTYPDGMNKSGGWDKNTLASQINNPLALLKEQDHERLMNFNTHANLSFALSRDFKLDVFGSYSSNPVERAQYLPTWVWAQGQAYRSEARNEDWLTNASLNYSRNFNGHGLKAKIQGEYQSRVKRGFFTTVKGFSTNDLGYDNLAYGAYIPYGGTGSDYDNPRIGSGLAQVSYDFMGIFSLTANARADGSSMFGTDNKWGFFPSISGTYNVLKSLPNLKADWLNKLDLRSGYGISGNTGGIESYNSMLLLNPNGRLLWNGLPTTTLGMTSNANPDLKWETRSTFNVGGDFGFLNNRVVLTAEYYYSKTKDMLYMYDVPVPPFVYDKLLANIGSMSNSGLEIGLGCTPIQKKDMELNVNVNVAFQKNKLLSLSGEYNGMHLSAPDVKSMGELNGAGFHGGDNNIVYQIVGQSLGVFYLPHAKGLKKNENGQYEYEIEDLNGDGVIDISDNGGDRYIAGQATPKMTLGSNISFRYKNVDLSVQMNGAFGHKIYNGTSLTYMNMSSFPAYNVLADAPGANIADQTATDYWLESGNYLNFDYVTLGWNVPVKKESSHIGSLRLSLSVSNLATITKYSGLTPMINSYAVGSTLGIDDKRSVAPYRTYSLGVSMQF